MSYTRVIPIEFNHCDPAGMVFYPRYFEMTNSLVENFFADCLDDPFARMTVQDGRGVPTVKIEIAFRAPSRLGDKVAFTLAVRRVGTSSVTFDITARCGEELRLTGTFTLVHIGVGKRPEPWPARVRARLAAQLEEDNG